MGNKASKNNHGFVCPVKGCPKKHNRRFSRVLGLVLHLDSKHPGYLEKKLNLKKEYRKKGDVNQFLEA